MPTVDAIEAFVSSQQPCDHAARDPVLQRSMDNGSAARRDFPGFNFTQAAGSLATQREQGSAARIRCSTAWSAAETPACQYASLKNGVPADNRRILDPGLYGLIDGLRLRRRSTRTIEIAKAMCAAVLGSAVDADQ